MFSKQLAFQASSKVSLSRKYDKNEANAKSKAKVDPNLKPKEIRVGTTNQLTNLEFSFAYTHRNLTLKLNLQTL